MRYLMAFLFVLLCGIVQAAPSCVPGIYGPQWPGSSITGLIRGDKAWMGWGWCVGSTGAPYPVYRLCAHGECVSDIGGQVGRIAADLGRQLIDSDKRTVYGSWFDANPAAYHCEDDGGAQVTEPQSPRGQACAELRRLLAADRPTYEPPPPPPPPPPAYTHAVKVNTACTLPTGCTRPVYMLINGARSTTSIGRADVGQPCDLTKPTLPSGADVWASFGPLFEPGKVALCSAK